MIIEASANHDAHVWDWADYWSGISEEQAFEAEIALIESERFGPAAGSHRFIPLADTDAFDAFWDHLNGDIGIDKETAFQLACNCELIIGGGAAPLFRVGFVD